MLDVIAKLASDTLHINAAEVARLRDALLEEVASAEPRYAATQAIVHPEGSTTPLKEAFHRAQQTYAAVREDAHAVLPKAFAMLLALDIATKRRDEAEKHLTLKTKEAAANGTMTVKPNVADFWGRLYRHGVNPSQLDDLAEPIIAIIADLISWKAKDSKFKLAENPWRAVLEIYAGRRIEKPSSKRDRAVRSVPGTPARHRHIKDERLGDYMFNEMLADLPPARVPETPAPAAVSPTFDCSIYPDEEGAEVKAETHALGEAVEVTLYTSDQESRATPGEALFVPDMPPSEETHGGELDAARAHAMAEAVYEANPLRTQIFWPKGWSDYADFGSSALAEALARAIAEQTAWQGQHEFLAAIRAGEGREFIDWRRRAGIDHLANQIMAGDERALDHVAKAGIEL